MIFGTDDVLSSVLEFCPVYHESVVVADVSFHELHRLPEFLVVVIPGQGRCRNRYNSASKLYALALVSECALGFDDESWGSLSTIY